MRPLRPPEPEASAAGGRPAPGGWQVAYLTNCYPATSHSFIRNEILALERQGARVLRVTVRRSAAALVDPADLAEARRTVALLENKRRLAAAAIARAVRHPRRFAAALRLTLATRGGGRIRALAYLAEACRLVALTEAAGIGHVHVHFGTNPATVARLASRLGRLSYSMTVHGPDEFDAPVAIGLRDKIADARLTVAISDHGRSQLLRWADPADWHKVAVVRCGVAPSFRADAAADSEGSGAAALVCVARLSAQKGLPLLLDAAAAVARTDAFVLRLVGDGELRAPLAAAIAARGLDERVALLGWRDAAGVRAELARARALVLPSFAEGLPVVLMEALALGRPVIATAVAGIPELVDAETGWLVRPGSATALADAMRAALRADPARLRALGRVGQARVRRDHDVDVNAARLAALLARAAGASDYSPPLRPNGAVPGAPVELGHPG